MDDDAVRAAATLGESLLRPAAEAVDVAGVPRSHVAALGSAGLLGVMVPTEAGGGDCSPAVMRAVTEELAAADASTWFVWTQHHTPVRTLVRGDNHELRRQWLPRLAADVLAGVAFTHLRRPGPPAVAARRAGTGWRLSGEIAWLTSWSLAEVFLVGAQSGDDVVWVLTPLHDRPQVRSAPLQLAAMGGTSTVRVRLDDLPVRDDEVVLVEPVARWREVDAARTADVSPAVFGVTAETVRRLREHEDGAARDLADAVDERLGRLRTAAYDLIDAGPGGDVAERLQLRAAAHTLACTATAGLVAAGAGRSMLLDNAAQRLARVALFLLVQGQTAAVRAATLRALALSPGASGT